MCANWLSVTRPASDFPFGVFHPSALNVSEKLLQAFSLCALPQLDGMLAGAILNPRSNVTPVADDFMTECKGVQYRVDEGLAP